MQSLTVISFILNIGLVILCLSLVYPKAIRMYMDKKKQREHQRDKERKEYIQQVVREYLEELKNG